MATLTSTNGKPAGAASGADDPDVARARAAARAKALAKLAWILDVHARILRRLAR